LIGKDPGSISRELSRNSSLKGMTRRQNEYDRYSKKNYHYLPNKAHKKYIERKSVA
jgi:hypothetical protein